MAHFRRSQARRLAQRQGAPRTVPAEPGIYLLRISSRNQPLIAERPKDTDVHAWHRRHRVDFFARRSVRAAF